MALIKPSVAGAISGKLAGAEFALTKHGSVMKSAKRHHNVKSAKWYRAQNAWAQYRAAWLALSADEQNAWTVYGQTHPVTNRLGTKRHLTGYQAFMTQTTIRTIYTVFPAQDAPPLRQTLPPTSISFTFTAGGAYGVTVYHPNYGMGPIAFRIGIARFIPPNQTRAPDTWVSLPPRTFNNGYNILNTAFSLENIELIQGERIAIKYSFQFIIYRRSLDQVVFCTVA